MICVKMAKFKSLQQATSDSPYILSGSILLGHLNSKHRIEKMIVLVEGKDDKPVYSTFLDINRVDFRDCYGCINVWKERQNLKIQKSSLVFITILDSDFRRLDNKCKNVSDVFYTDHHDAEMLMFTSQSLLKSLFFRLTNEKSYVDLKKRVDNELFIISMLKWYNMKEKCKYKFEKSDLSTVCWNSQVDLSTAITYFHKTSKSRKPLDLKIFRIFLKNNSSVDINQLMNGHDFLGRLAAIYRKDYKKQISDNDFRELVCELFNLKHARKLKIYYDIENWAKKQNLDIVLH